MIVISMVLVVVGFVTLMLGVLDVGEEPLNWVYTSIGACILAGVFLIGGVLRSRPSRKAALGVAAPEPAAAGWSGSGPDASTTAALSREGPGGQAAAPVSAPSPTPAPEGEQERASALDSWRPQTLTGAPSGLSRPAPTQEPRVDEDVEPEDEEPEDEEFLVGRQEAEPADATAPPPPKKVAKKAAVKKAAPKKAAKKAAAKKSAEKAGAKKAAKKAGAKKAAKKAGAKKAAAKETGSTAAANAATPAAGPSGGDEARRIAEGLRGVQGCGPAKQRKLAERFGTYEQLQSASVAEIAEVEGVSWDLAERIHQRLNA